MLKESRKARPEILTVDRLLDTAALLFWEKGYTATTTREIASAVEIQQASLYYHIASKEDLLHRLCVSSLQVFLINVPAALDGVTAPLDRIRVMIRTHIGTLLKHQERNVAMLTELRALAPRHRAEVVKLRGSYLNILRTAIQDAQAARLLRDDIPATYLCLALLNILNWTSLWFRKDQALSAEPLAELFIEIYFHGVALPPRRGGIPVPELKPLARKRVPRARKFVPAAESLTVERLLKAAVAVFSRKGYAATSTREVAALLGMQKASLYYHIEGKEDLLYFICRSSLERIRSDVASALQGVPDPLDRIRLLIVSHVESMLRDADEHSTTLAEMQLLSPDRYAQVRALRDSYEDLVRSVLHEAQHAGLMRADIDVKYLCLALLGLMNRVLVWYHRKGPLTPGQLGELLAAIFLTGVAAHSD
jgi:TetR/AcrR family transcriptional regulator, cholesterol catabolism regulator